MRPPGRPPPGRACRGWSNHDTLMFLDGPTTTYRSPRVRDPDRVGGVGARPNRPARPHTGRVTLDRNSPLPLWAQVLGDLRTRLARGEFTGRFPGDEELRAQYGVSRHTVREA